MSKYQNLVFLLGLALVGCAQESGTDYNKRKADSDRERAAAVRSDDQQAAGIYEGSTPAARLTLTLEVVDSNQDGFQVPFPTLAGKLRIYPQVLVTGSETQLQTEYTFDNGLYDPGSGKLSFTVEKDQKASTISCTDHGGSLACTWNSRDSDASFQLTRTPAAPAQTPGRTPGSTYSGDDGKHAVEVTFGMALSNDGVSDVPRRVILGKFYFTEKNPPRSRAANPVRVQLKSTDGTFDLGTGSLVFTIDDDGQGTKVKVNCAILTSSSLHCQWFGRDDAAFDLHASPADH